MDERKLKLAIGALMHDVGKELFRTSEEWKKHAVLGEAFLKEQCSIDDREILDAVRYHHGSDLRRAKLPGDSLAYITYVADNIAAAGDRREKESGQFGFDKNIAMESVFNVLNGNAARGKYKACYLNHDNGINYPLEEAIRFDESYYKAIKLALSDKLKQLTLSSAYMTSLCEILESYLTYVPSSTSTNELPDISLYDHMKMTAAFAVCIYDYFNEKGWKNFSDLLTNSKKYEEEEMFYLYSFDISGIQSFIYNVSSEKALRSLRTRSFYLEIFLQDCIDTLLERLELFRFNLLYSGGGHCYFILPNTEGAKVIVEEFKNEINEWLISTFGSELFLAGGGASCSAKAFKGDQHAMYKDLFRAVSSELSRNKLHRYGAESLRKLNFSEVADGARECKVCHRVDHLMESENGLVCTICNSIQLFSKDILTGKFFIIEKEEIASDKASLPLPFNRRLITEGSEKALREHLKSNEGFIRAYTKNDAYSGEGLSTKLWIGDYSANNELNLLAKDSQGIERLGVIRADVDNLGKSFVEGLPKEYVSLTRSAVFSRNMSLFFKYHINYLLENGRFSLTSEPYPIKRRALVVYSGGDDLFVVGSWNDIIEFSVDLVESLSKFTLGSLTLSAGIGIYPSKFPIKAMAEQTGKLEEFAKEHHYMEAGIARNKNAVCLFQEDSTFSWKIFKEKVLGEKLNLLINYLAHVDERGKSFLYRMLDLLREQSDDGLHLARLAYLLARLEPKEKEKREAHDEFSKQIYRFAKNKTDRDELITAIYIYIYLERR